MPIVIMLMGMTFNGINTYLQARWVNTLSSPYLIDWLITTAIHSRNINFFYGIHYKFALR